MAALAQPRVERLSDLGPLLAFLFSGRLPLRPEDFRGVKLDETEMRRAFEMALGSSTRFRLGTRSPSKRRSRASPSGSTRKSREVARPFYVAITGSPTSIPLYDSMELLGRDLVRERLRDALALLERPTRSRLTAMIRAIVLAAGKGTRMKSARSKVLHELCGRPMLWYVIRALRGAGIEEILVVVNAELEGEIARLQRRKRPATRAVRYRPRRESRARPRWSRDEAAGFSWPTATCRW